MNDSKEAVKTEYKGIVFDSKSEAVFARTLESTGNEFVYHPRKHCGHDWDFLVFPVSPRIRTKYGCVGGEIYDSSQRYPVWSGKPILVEYKPTMPTTTYVENLTRKMSENPLESIIVWGNPWDHERPEGDMEYECRYRVYPIFSSYWKHGWGNYSPMADCGMDIPYASAYRLFMWEVFGITDRFIDEARSYRFDLA